VSTYLISELLASHGSAIFLITDEGEYSFEYIEDSARRFANQLRSLGITKGDHIALLAGNHAAYLVAWFGVTMAGAVLVALNNRLIADGLRYSVRQSVSKLIVARSRMDGPGPPSSHGRVESASHRPDRERNELS
jgi:crotonobetaine/carnitine-CoA ligase